MERMKDCIKEWHGVVIVVISMIMLAVIMISFIYYIGFIIMHLDETIVEVGKETGTVINLFKKGLEQAK